MTNAKLFKISELDFVSPFFRPLGHLNGIKSKNHMYLIIVILKLCIGNNYIKITGHDIRITGNLAKLQLNSRKICIKSENSFGVFSFVEETGLMINYYYKSLNQFLITVHFDGQFHIISTIGTLVLR
ncbi:hypothetical protein QTP88_012772 [Uroleucon formosanum]